MTDTHPEITLDSPAELLLALDDGERTVVLARLRREYVERYPIPACFELREVGD
jgi:hypothetical protein